MITACHEPSAIPQSTIYPTSCSPTRSGLRASPSASASNGAGSACGPGGPGFRRTSMRLSLSEGAKHGLRSVQLKPASKRSSAGEGSARTTPVGLPARTPSTVQSAWQGMQQPPAQSEQRRTEPLKGITVMPSRPALQPKKWNPHPDTPDVTPKIHPLPVPPPPGHVREWQGADEPEVAPQPHRRVPPPREEW